MPIVDLPLPLNAAVRYYCWDLTEDWTDLFPADSAKHINIYRQEFAKKKLTDLAFRRSVVLETYDSGKPKPIEGIHISFSHSGNTIVLCTSELNVGIDLQYYTDKLVRVSHKFVSEHERSLLSEDIAKSNQQIHMLWCAKEAVFKLYGTEVPFQEIVAATLDLEIAGTITFTVKGQCEHPVQYCFFDDFCFCIAL